MKTQIVSFHCVLKNRLGRVIGQTTNHDVLTQPLDQKDTMLIGLAHGMQDLKKGERRSIELTAKDAYGFYDPAKVIVRSRDELEANREIRQGDQVTYRSSDGGSRQYRVTEISSEFITLDGNHPLAGQDLVFEIEAIEVRDATPEDLADSVSVETPLLN